WSFVRLLGLSVFTIALVRLLTLGVVCMLLYAAARQVLGCGAGFQPADSSGRLETCPTAAARQVLRRQDRAVLAALSPLLIPAIAWNSVNYLTHTLLLCALCLATVCCVLRLSQARRLCYGRRGWGGYALLGVCVGMGVLSKYNYAVFAAALLLAALA